MLVAHVWWDDTPCPFHRLCAVEPGATIERETTVARSTTIRKAASTDSPSSEARGP